jgi:glucose 1-dehydrogenase
MNDFRGKRVFVTGAGQGIGYGLCAAFATAGAIVALNDVNPDLAADASKRINAMLDKPRVYPHPFDVSNVDEIRGAIESFTTPHGPLDVVIANAGITDYGPFLETTPDQFDQITGVNLRGSYFTAQLAAKNMIAAQVQGRILLMSSVVGVQAHKALAAYGVTKAGIAHMASLLALELGEYRITVNAISPGATLTERTQQVDPNYADNWASVAANGRVGTVADVVHAALFLAAPESRHITGQTLIVDGGWTIHSPLHEDHLPTDT